MTHRHHSPPGDTREGTRASVWKPIVPLLCSREAAIFWWRCDLRLAGSVAAELAATPTFPETFSSFNECVRSLCVRNLSIIERRLDRSSSSAHRSPALAPSQPPGSGSGSALGARAPGACRALQQATASLDCRTTIRTITRVVLMG